MSNETEKTAMQIAIETLKTDSEGSSTSTMIAFGSAIKILEELRDTKEREQLISAFETKPFDMKPEKEKPGFYVSKDLTGEQLYNENYGSNE